MISVLYWVVITYQTIVLCETYPPKKTDQFSSFRKAEENTSILVL